MSALPPALAALVNAPELDLNNAAHCLLAEDAEEGLFDAGRFLALAERLPSGLVHAEAIWVTASPPVGLDPLAPGSIWYAIDRSLVAAISPGRSALLALVVDLARYGLACRAIAERLSSAPPLIEALGAGAALAPAAAAELALRLGADAEQAARIEASPSLKRDLAALATQPFSPEVHLHPSTRPAKWRRLGTSIGRRIADALPEGPVRLLISDAPEAVEHLSPYVRDLAAELSAWALENRALLRTAGLAEVIEAGDGRFSPADLAALVVPDLLHGRPELLEERRRVERATGLELFDEAGVTFGVAELSTLAAPDPRAVPPGSRGALVAIAGPAHETLLEAARVLLESGRVEGVALIFGSAQPAAVLVPEALVAPDDAVECEAAAKLAKRAELSGLKLPKPVAVEVDDEEAAPRALFDLLRLVRRAQLLGGFPADSRPVPILYGRAASGRPAALDRRLGVVFASRLALSALISGEGAPSGRGVDPAKSSSSLRFRA